MKIKRKVQKNLPQLIEWGFEKGVHGVQFKSDRGKRVGFRHMGYFWTEYKIDKDELFTIITEEEIDENTKLPKLLAIFEHNENLYSEMHNNKNINDILKMDIKVKSSSTNTIHMVNDDGTHTLIWRDGKLVE